MPGLIGGPRTYEGPGLGDGPWKCPACGVENVGPLDYGCTSCGSGSARPRHVGQPPPADLQLAGFDSRRGTEQEPPRTPRVEGKTDTDQLSPAQLAGYYWIDAHPSATPIEAFLAGVAYAQQQTMAAPPVTADVRALTPEGKPRRTIIAALELFKDQILRDATEEIASGEWLTIEETELLIQQLRDEEGDDR